MTGNSKVGFLEEDLDGDFDAKKFDKLMNVMPISGFLEFTCSYSSTLVVLFFLVMPQFCHLMTQLSLMTTELMAISSIFDTALFIFQVYLC